MMFLFQNSRAEPPGLQAVSREKPQLEPLAPTLETGLAGATLCPPLPIHLLPHGRDSAMILNEEDV